MARLPLFHRWPKLNLRHVDLAALLLGLGLLLLAIRAPSDVAALGTPQITKIDPPSPSTVGTCVTIRARVDWDSEFRSMRMRFGNEGWQEEATTEFERMFCTGYLSPGWYTIRVEVAQWGDNSWSNPTWTEASYQLTEPPAPPPGPAISQIIFNPPDSAQVGTTVGIHIKVESSNPGAIHIYVPCGWPEHFEHTVPEYDTNWYTLGCGDGTQTVRVCARDVQDPDWQNPTCSERPYTLTSPPPEAPTAEFWVDTSTIQQGECSWLHWQTTNATSVDIDGTPVSTAGNMYVCPPVTKHYSLKAIGPGGEATRSLSILVVSPIPSPTATPIPFIARPSPTPPEVQSTKAPTSTPTRVRPNPTSMSTSPSPFPTRIVIEMPSIGPPQESMPSAQLKEHLTTPAVSTNICSGQHSWVEFHIPTGHNSESLYIHTNFLPAWLIVEAINAITPDWRNRIFEVGGPVPGLPEYEIIRMGVHGSVTGILTLGCRVGVFLPALQDPSNWWLAYELG